MMESGFTVLMAVRNGEPFLRTAIDSILSQTYRQFRFLIVDDASTDHTREIVRSYDDRRIEMLCLERNVGQTAALNIGVRHAGTPWIARMDADDYSAPTRLEEQARVLARDASLGCVGTAIWEFRQNPGLVEAIKLRPEEHAGVWRAALQGSGMIHGTIVVGRAALLEIGAFDERYRYAADRDMFIRLLRRYRATNIPRPLVGIRRHPHQDSFSLRAADEYIDIFERLLGQDGHTRDEVAVLRHSLAYSHLFRARCYRVDGRYRAWWTDLASAFRLSPRTCALHAGGRLTGRLLPQKIRAPFRHPVFRERDDVAVETGWESGDMRGAR